MALTDSDAAKHSRHSMFFVDAESEGFEVLRYMNVFGADDAPHGHGHCKFTNVKVPAENLILGEGRGFEVSQGRLGPGRIHHCMRAIGQAEKALELMIRRSKTRKAFGKELTELGANYDIIANCRMEIEQSRLLCLKAAWMMDTAGVKAAQPWISQIKVVAPLMALKVIDEQIPLDDIHINKTKSDDIAFQKLKVKVKNEIIRFNSLLKNSDKKNLKSITPHRWDKIIRNDAQIIDMRNNFEYNLGTFKGAINLCLINFTDLKDKTAELDKLDKKKKTAIFCTGGIRCEKAGKYLSDIGFKDVYQLQGGIINYLNSTKNKYWKGECFVFDDRILLKGNS